MKKHIMIITFALFALSYLSNGQRSKTNIDEQIEKHQEDSKLNQETLNDSNAALLKWKLKPDETIGYKTVMEQVESSDLEIDFGDDMDISAEAFKEIFDGLKKEFEQTSFITTMQWNDRDYIEIKMFTEGYKKKDPKPIDPQNFNPASMMEGVLLRGEISERGQIESFYLKSAQKNLIAIFFELPNKAVKIGDTWSLNVNYLQYDQSFVCKSADRTNKVELIDVPGTIMIRLQS